ncbi:2-C-methyl-D-erythritol 2,4-cyclodiphosphate synthase [Dissulfurimicrobium hydrothermale]|nr:2-C-methyl-D-erythritol 2,4-cyclodiphosphate synthase [Dissulfurimicrobium hydrothermale]UKL13445.1 2-C-methyl-D-erythritol 2,4-cyclodiphosphate synthase [Dissulfurimicrobium hydrothermale]
MFRVGFGYDVHRLVPGRRLVLAGVDIPFHLGLSGHSDADVLTHALCDAILGAAGLGDIGRHFPDADMRYKDISSLIFLERIAEMIEDRGLLLGNADVTVVAQAPKITPFVPRMLDNLASTLKIRTSLVNIKATTTEGLGFTGTGDGIAAYAVACLIAS